ncbi:M23 family metallopeptidase [Thermotalea metallivorans]|uniref:Murein DD-endopeptidase MepM n=1 Tax=Thermotalea metallivorans TaxID=520762 RepID=A0A140L6U6_9FIRM|nr:M23 family metallopeptidase [Thermotalea metallivorans]KXG76271.1 Murein DD-endopeptidase MepM [Thermotalea metallivorans]
MDKKGWFSRKKSENTFEKKESSIYKFLDKEGFYVILFLCLCIVATSAVWVAKTHIDRLAVEDLKKPWLPEEKDMGDIPSHREDAEENQAPVVVIEEKKEMDTAPAMAGEINKGEGQLRPKAESQPKPQEKVNVAKAEKKSKPASANANSIIMKIPVAGKIGMGYAADRLVYSKTLDQYTTHYGVDIIAPENTPVVAVLPGEVIEVTNDSRLGIVIAIAHEGDIITRYANLSTSEMVKVGDKVEKGQVISGVGKTALFESLEEPHLHFEVLMDGKNVDPTPYLPKLKN